MTVLAGTPDWLTPVPGGSAGLLANVQQVLNPNQNVTLGPFAVAGYRAVTFHMDNTASPVRVIARYLTGPSGPQSNLARAVHLGVSGVTDWTIPVLSSTMSLVLSNSAVGVTAVTVSAFGHGASDRLDAGRGVVPLVSLIQVPIGAGASSISTPTDVVEGPATIVLMGPTTAVVNWRLAVDVTDFAGTVTRVWRQMSTTGAALSQIAGQLYLPAQPVTVTLVNNDAAARNFDLALVAGG